MKNVIFYVRLVCWFFVSSHFLFAFTNDQTGLATFYHSRFWGFKTTSGEKYHPYKFTAAHKTFPLHSLVEVYFPKTHKKTIVRINDRGPFRRGAVIDLSLAAAKEIGLIPFGVSSLEIKLISDADSIKKYRNELEVKDLLAEKLHVRKISKKKYHENKLKRKSKSNFKKKSRQKSNLKKKSKKKFESDLKIKSEQKSDLKIKSIGNSQFLLKK